MKTIHSIEPTSRQKLAFSNPAKYVLYGGAMGGGKSFWLCAYALELSMRYPGGAGYLCRHELTSFKKTTQQTLDRYVLPEALVAQHNRSENFYMLKNGSRIWYGGLGDDKRAIEKLKSLEINWYGIDQAEETTEEFFHMLNTRLRLVVSSSPNLRYKGLLTANPAGNWVKDRFVIRLPEDHAFIPALPKDNPFLPSGYEDELRRDLPEELVKIYIEGDWEAVSETQSVYSYKAVMAAMERVVEPKEHDRVTWGCDVAEYGTDETVLAKKHGNKVTLEEKWLKQGPMTTVGKIIQKIDHDKKVELRIDAIGPGNGVYHRLLEQGYNAVAIRGSESPHLDNRRRFKNIKTQFYWDLREDLPHLDIPDDLPLRGQMTTCMYKVLSSDGLYRIESKEELRKRGLRSPDRMEAIIYANAHLEEGREFHVMGDEAMPALDENEMAQAVGGDDWEQKLIKLNQEKGDTEKMTDVEKKMELMTTPENARRYIIGMADHGNMDKIADELDVSVDLLRQWVSRNLEYINAFGKGARQSKNQIEVI